VVSQRVVVDASAIVDLLLGNEIGVAVAARLSGEDMHAPAHLDAEVLSALGRLHRDGQLAVKQVRSRLEALVDAPIERHQLPSVVLGAWARRQNLRLVDAIYVELAEQLGASLVTTDQRLAASATVAEFVGT
jgi:predicted nucleic acid-binding protein